MFSTAFTSMELCAFVGRVVQYDACMLSVLHPALMPCIGPALFNLVRPHCVARTSLGID